MTTWFTSDPHFLHVNVITYCDRPFKDNSKTGKTAVESMTDTLVKNWNDVVTDDDVVFVLGDFSLGKAEEALTIPALLNGHKKLVVGNHDRNFRYKKGEYAVTPALEEWDAKYKEAGFEEIFHQNVTLVNHDGNEPVLLSHFPYQGDSHDGDRYESARPTDSGLALVHGHTHAKTVVSYSDKGTIQVHVGVDSHNFRPVSYEWISNLIRAERRA